MTEGQKDLALPELPFDRDVVKTIIPHREPFLFVDAITALEPGVSATGVHYVDTAGFWARGHFPLYPVMPGVLTVEACAQVGAVALLSLPENRDKLAFFAGIDKVRFKNQVIPAKYGTDEQTILEMSCQITKQRGPIGFGEATAHVWDGEDESTRLLVFAGDLMFAIGDKPE